MVDLVRAYSNRADLCDDLARAVVRLRSAQLKQDFTRQSVQSISTPRALRLHDRLTDDEVAKLLACYQQGTTFRELAEQFAVSTTSVKKILKVNEISYRGHKFRK